MPNHVLNIVKISGGKESISRFKEANIDKYVDSEGDTKPFSFQTIIPRPNSLDITSSSRAAAAMEYLEADDERKQEILKRNWIEEDMLEDFVKLGEAARDNLAKYGYTDWYYWSVDNWGTKWDCYEVSADCHDTEIILTFQTAWAAPKPIYAAIARENPDLSIVVDYADEDYGSNCATLTFKGGKLTDEVMRDFNFAIDLWDEEC